MPITVYDAQSELKEECGALLALVDKDATVTSVTASQTYKAALREGLASLGLSPASFSVITDTDLSFIADADVSKFLDISKLRLLMMIGGAYMEVDETISLGSQKFSQLRQSMADRIANLEAFVKAKYGYGLGSLTAGGIDLRSSRRFDEMASGRRWRWRWDDF